MFQLKITGIWETVGDWPTHVISVIDTRGLPHGAKWPFEGAPKHLEIRADDITSLMRALPDERRFDTFQALQIMEFARGLDDNSRLLVHCHGGQCRSTAVAMAVLCMHGETELEALKTVLNLRSNAEPNHWICHVFDDELGTILESVALEHMRTRHNWNPKMETSIKPKRRFRV